MNEFAELVSREVKGLGEVMGARVASLEEKVGAFGSQLLAIEQKSAGGGVELGEPADPLAAVFASEQFKRFQSKETRSTGAIALPGSVLYRKSVLTTDGAGSPTSVVTPDNTVAPFFAGWTGRRLSLLDALPRQPVTTGALTFNRLASFSQSADVQAGQEAAKAEQTLNSDLVTAAIATVAVIQKVSEQALMDIPWLRQQVIAILGAGVLEKVEDQLINGSGSAGQMRGLLTDAGAAVTTADSTADRIGEVADDLSDSGYEPSLVIMNPVTWGKLRRERATDNQYVAGSFRDPSPPNVWGIPVVATPAIVAGTVIVLDRSRVALLDRQSLTTEFSNSDGSNFSTNVVSIRVEGRWGLATFDPGAVKTFGSGSPV